MNNSIAKLINVIKNLDTIRQALENITVNNLDNNRLQLVSLIENTKEELTNV